MPVDYYRELDKRVSLIQRLYLQKFVKEVVHKIPERMWSAPSSFYHHLDDERIEWGNALHTLRVVDTCLIFVDSLLIVDLQRDLLIAAAILHDIGKRGLKGDTFRIMTALHPFIVRDIVRDLDLPNPPQEIMLVFEIIEDHMGKWTTRSLPRFLGDKTFSPSAVLHLADCIVARWPEVGKVEVNPT